MEKERSVFKDFREDTQVILQKCFDEDFSFSKIPKTIKKTGAEFDSEVERIKEILMVHYARITNIFYFYSGCSSTYPMLSMNDFTSFAKLTGILDHDVISLAALDLALVATCMSSHEYVNSARLDMTRYEFLEMIVRVANEMFRETKVVKTTS